MKKDKQVAKPDAAEILAEKKARDAYKAACEKCRADLKAAKDRLTEALATKSTEYQRDLMREHHKQAYRRELEKDPDFIGWLGERDGRGHERYAMKCSRCHGADKQCGRCRGTGKESFPRYCKDCGDMLPHHPSVVCVH